MNQQTNGRVTYVPALKEARTRVEVMPQIEMPPMMPTAQTTVELHTTYTDRSMGFQLATLPISIAFGVGALIVAIVGWNVPFISIGALTIFWLAFLGWWLLGWAIHHIASPDGIALVQAVLMFRYVRFEQKERHSHYARLRADERNRE